jgi:beta-glucosidase
VAKLTLEQKIELLGGVDNMFTHAAPAIDLPRFKMSDGPIGVRTWGPTTAYVGGAALAATWDPALARRTGEGLGRDARARGVHFLLGPGVNIARSPLNGRNFEYFSEDPFLAASMTVPYIEGVQSQGVIATVKHFALNDQEYNRHNVSVDVDERTMREIYLPAFEAAVTQGPCGRGDELLQPGQRRPRHAERVSESEGAQGRVGLPGHSHVGLGRHLRYGGRCQ